MTICLGPARGGNGNWQLGPNSVSFPPFMATIKAFAALRPKPELAARICELPYDVMSSEEARQIAAGNPAELPPRQQAGD